MRTSAGWSEVATTTTRAREALGPRSRSMNSRTSRPRSPTRQITLTSADVERAIMPSSEDLPTPEPAKMPRRWPRPQGTSASSARTPSDDALVDARARERVGRRGARRAGAQRGRRRSGRARRSGGRGRRARGRAARRRPSTRNGSPVAVHARARADARRARRAASAACGRRGSRRPRRAPAARPRPVSIVQTSPTSASRPVASTIRPIRSQTRPWRRCRSASRMRAGGRASSGARARVMPRRARRLDDLARALELGLDARVDVAVRRAHDGAAAADAALGLDLAVLDAAERGDAARPSPRARSRGRPGCTSTIDALALDDAAQRAADGLDDELGLRRRSAPPTTFSASSERRARRRAPRAARPRAPARRAAPRRPRSSADGGGRERRRAPRRGPAAKPSARAASRIRSASASAAASDHGRRRRRRRRPTAARRRAARSSGSKSKSAASETASHQLVLAAARRGR